jgi:hypothetical protein
MMENQGLRVRLTMKQEGMFRCEFFPKLMVRDWG